MTSVDRCPACGAGVIDGQPAVVRHCGDRNTTCRWVKCRNPQCKAVIYPAKGRGFTALAKRIQPFTFGGAA